MQVEVVETRRCPNQAAGQRQHLFRPHSFPDPMAQESEEKRRDDNVESEAEDLRGDPCRISRRTLFHEPSDAIETNPPG